MISRPESIAKEHIGKQQAHFLRTRISKAILGAEGVFTIDLSGFSSRMRRVLASDDVKNPTE